LKKQLQPFALARTTAILYKPGGEEIPIHTTLQVYVDENCRCGYMIAVKDRKTLAGFYDRKYFELQTLEDCMPKEFGYEFTDTIAYKFKDVIVVREHRVWRGAKPWIGIHKNVNYWVELQNGYAVGMNENPSHGLSFPVVKMKRKEQKTNHKLY